MSIGPIIDADANQRRTLSLIRRGGGAILPNIEVGASFSSYWICEGDIVRVVLSKMFFLCGAIGLCIEDARIVIESFLVSCLLLRFLSGRMNDIRGLVLTREDLLGGSVLFLEIDRGMPGAYLVQLDTDLVFEFMQFSYAIFQLRFHLIKIIYNLPKAT